MKIRCKLGWSQLYVHIWSFGNGLIPMCVWAHTVFLLQGVHCNINVGADVWHSCSGPHFNMSSVPIYGVPAQSLHSNTEDNAHIWKFLKCLLNLKTPLEIDLLTRQRPNVLYSPPPILFIPFPRRQLYFIFNQSMAQHRCRLNNPAPAQDYVDVEFDITNGRLITNGIQSSLQNTRLLMHCTCTLLETLWKNKAKVRFQ